MDKITKPNDQITSALQKNVQVNNNPIQKCYDRKD